MTVPESHDQPNPARPGLAAAPAAPGPAEAPPSEPGRVLFAGQMYYHTWYASRALRDLGWKADVVHWDDHTANAGYYHGYDFLLETEGDDLLARHMRFFAWALSEYDIFHFSNAHAMFVSPLLRAHFADRWGGEGAELRLLRALGKKVVYSNNGCLDGVTQTSFARWGPWSVCEDCVFRTRPDVCSDERNARWGAFRNAHVDLQLSNGGNRVDFNDHPTMHDVPEFYCMDPDVWRPDLEIPPDLRLDLPASTVKLYHAVGNFDIRTNSDTGRNIKSTHIYIPLVERLKASGIDVELVFATGLANMDVRFLQAQSDIVVDMLTVGIFGANVREALMLGKPAVCFLRPEWLDSMRREIPEYVDELPIVNATPDTIEPVLRDLIGNPEKRAEIGRRSRAFAVKWHSGEAGARRLDALYRRLLTDGIPPVAQRPGPTRDAGLRPRAAAV